LKILEKMNDVKAAGNLIEDAASLY